RGHSGPIRITDRKQRDPDVLSDAFIAACREASIPETGDYNTGSYEGVRYLEQTIWNGRRVTTATAYLRDAAKRPNLRIESEALACSIVFEGTRAVGVEYVKHGTRQTVRAAREVVLAAGAIQSPQLLELSGVGEPERLRSFGIPVVAAIPAVGEHMVDHLQVRCTYRTNVPITINDIMRSRWHKMRFGLRYLLRRRGLLAGTSSTAHAITRTVPQLTEPDVMVRIYHISGRDRFSRSKEAGIDPFPGFSIGGFKLQPVSRGWIHIRSRDPREYPGIEPRYLADPADRRTAIDLMRLVRRIASQPAMRPYIVEESRPGPAAGDDDALLEYIRDTGQTAWHTVGTCSMGPPGDAVVDARLRVYGVTGLRVADTSVMPTIPSSNTNAAAIMVGERAADFLMQDAH
ncbi:MAG TPA: GMC oxidoreductase, partial [Casimicrobiaceae bacterium]|nr:GMC oxidoreductase [Casimicrobiaceae bacterium]